ncbi:MAG: sulfotransferase, partial [Spirochaetales bacterium]|nr:sulfotransferase [Spirochaetales bacterium]
MMTSKRVTRTDYAHPHRPLPVRLINRLGNIGVRFGDPNPSSRFSDAALLERASRLEGLDDFGDPSFRPGLRALVAAIESEAGLTPVGRWITRKRLLGTLRNRLRAEKLFRDHPEILDLQIRPPIVITGMQRTGTTLLHRLLAADPDTRTVLSWEALNPAPYLNARGGCRGPGYLSRERLDPRLRVARISQRALALMAPDFFAVHPVEVEAPEEDVLLLDYSF